MRTIKYALLLLCELVQATEDSSFPYGAPKAGNVSISNERRYATPETMLGSWAMLQAVQMDKSSNILPSFMNEKNTAYAVGTAAIGNLLGVANCGGGCDVLNGFCFALKFDQSVTPHPNYPYMIFQSVNIGANENSFDIYLPGGGSGAFPEFCPEFWVGSDANVKWGEHILDSSCDTYFNHFNFTSGYNVTYANKNHNAVDTLKSACEFAYTTSGFSLSNFNNVKIVPVACPSTLTQVTGLRLTDDVKKVGNQSIQTLGTLTDADFDKIALVASTTQMQDCKSPSSSYDNKVKNAVENYQASISAELTHPVLMEEVPSIVNYCTKNPSVTAFCSWDNGASAGGPYCDQSESICLACGGSVPPKWCSCHQGELISCVAKK